MKFNMFWCSSFDSIPQFACRFMAMHAVHKPAVSSYAYAYPSSLLNQFLPLALNITSSREALVSREILYCVAGLPVLRVG